MYSVSVCVGDCGRTLVEAYSAWCPFYVLSPFRVCVCSGVSRSEVGYSLVCAMEVPGQNRLAASPGVGQKPPIPFPGPEGAPESPSGGSQAHLAGGESAPCSEQCARIALPADARRRVSNTYYIDGQDAHLSTPQGLGDGELRGMMQWRLNVQTTWQLWVPSTGYAMSPTCICHMLFRSSLGSHTILVRFITMQPFVS